MQRRYQTLLLGVVSLLSVSLPNLVSAGEETSPGIAAYQKYLAEQESAKVRQQEEAQRRQEQAQRVQEQALPKIEAMLAAKDFQAARELLKSCRSAGPWKDAGSVESVIAYVEAFADFYSLSASPGKTSEAIAAYEVLMRSYNSLPSEVPFSKNVPDFIEWSISKGEKFIQKECGDDFKKIKVGMKLSRVQKCFGEVDLRGQVQRKDGVFDQYTRGEVWLLVKKGKVVAWGD